MRLSLPNLINDRDGVLAVFVAIGAFPLAGSLVAAIDLGLQGSGHTEIQDIVQTACSRATAPTFYAAPAADREAAAQAVLDRLLPTTLLEITSATYTAADTGSGLTIQIDGDLRSITGGLASATDVSLSVNCDENRPPTSNIVFYDGFETPDVRDSGFYGWYVEPNLPNWRLIDGPGAQINRDPATDPSTFEGNQRIELDSDRNRGALPSSTTNTSIGRPVFLTPARYRLTYAFQRHAIALRASNSEVNVYLDPDDGSPLKVNEINRSATMNKNWINEAVEFDIATAGDYLLIFSAGGISLGFGGNIDAVQLERLP